MIAHYIKIAFRNMWKYKTQSLIGVFGLAFGIAYFVPALFWMRYETTYDSFYPDAENIYRIYTVEKQSGKVNEMVPGILKKKLHEHLPVTEISVGFVIEPDNYTVEGTPNIQMWTVFTDSTFFRVFPQRFVSGNARQPLQTLHNIIFTETVAVRLFGDVDKAIGQQIKSTNLFFLPPYTVTAVIKDPPSNTNLKFDVIIFSEIQNAGNMPETKQWEYFNQQMYVKFQPSTDVSELADQLRNFTSRPDINTNFEFRILAIGDIRYQLNTGLPFTLNFIRLFVTAGLLLLLSAFLNFLNLYLDLFRQRIRELRLRTVHGAAGGQIIMQMMFELACITLLALSFACCLVVLARPMFSGLLGITMEPSRMFHLFAVSGILVMVLMLLASIIPLWRLSHLVMRHLAKGRSTGQTLVRRTSVTVQLAVSIVFIVAALVVMMQMRYINRKELGFDRSGVVQLTGLESAMLWGKQTALINELAAIPQIENITATWFGPQHDDTRSMSAEVEWPGKPVYEKPVFHVVNADSQFAETFRLKMLMGKWWDEGEKQKIVLNEKAVQVMELSDPVGTIIRMSPDLVNSDTGIVPMQEYEVVGVVNDFHTLSLRNRLLPAIFKQLSITNNVCIRVVPGQEQEVMRQITAFLPGIHSSLVDASLTPLDELYDCLNRSEQVGLKLFSVMATISLLISLFGVYAVATSSTRRRRKEIAIRKVAGAEAGDIIRIFFREYTLQVIVACVVALPLAYLAMNRWLQGYAYHTDIPWWLLAGVIVVVVAMVLLTVWGQVLNAANSDPAEVVKSE